MDEMSGNWSWSISREKLFWLMLVELSETQSAQGSHGRRRRRRRGWAAPTWTCSCSAPTHSTSTLSTPRHWNCIQHLEHSQLTSGDSCSWAEQLLERQRGSDPTAQSLSSLSLQQYQSARTLGQCCQQSSSSVWGNKLSSTSEVQCRHTGKLVPKNGSWVISCRVQLEENIPWHQPQTLKPHVRA